MTSKRKPVTSTFLDTRTFVSESGGAMWSVLGRQVPAADKPKTVECAIRSQRSGTGRATQSLEKSKLRVYLIRSVMFERIIGRCCLFLRSSDSRRPYQVTPARSPLPPRRNYVLQNSANRNLAPDGQWAQHSSADIGIERGQRDIKCLRRCRVSDRIGELNLGGRDLRLGQISASN